MAIAVEHEDVEALKSWGIGLEKVTERCVFCRTETRHWHLPSNTPVCECCSGEREADELPVKSRVAC